MRLLPVLATLALTAFSLPAYALSITPAETFEPNARLHLSQFTTQQTSTMGDTAVAPFDSVIYVQPGTTIDAIKSGQGGRSGYQGNPYFDSNDLRSLFLTVDTRGLDSFTLGFSDRNDQFRSNWKVSSGFNVFGLMSQDNGETGLLTFSGFDGADEVRLLFRTGIKDGFSVFEDYERTTTAAVPLPAAGFLLAGAIGGLAFVRRKRSET